MNPKPNRRYIFPGNSFAVTLLTCFFIHQTSDVFAIDGTFSVTETWSATLTYSGWGDQNYSGTQQFSGTQNGTIVIANNTFTMLDQTGIPHEPPAGVSRTRTLNFNGIQYSISGGKVMPYILAGASLYGVMYLGEFVVQVPLVDGEIPAFYNSTSFQSSGTSLSSMSGSGRMTGSSLTVAITSASSWTVAPGPPSITANPSDRTVTAGTSTSFSVSAVGNPAPGFQWQRAPSGSVTWNNLNNTGNYSGVTTATLLVSSATAGMSGDKFRCVANNGNIPNATSSTATLTVNSPPSISTQPQNHSVTLGGTATFSVSASGTAPLSYQWRKGVTNVVGATNSSYSINNVQTNHAGTYSVVVSNAIGGVNSSNALLLVLYPPVLSLARMGGTNFLFLLSSPPGSTNVLQVTTNLLNWTSTSTSTIPVSGALTLTNSTAGNFRRSYRVYLK